MKTKIRNKIRNDSPMSVFISGGSRYRVSVRVSEKLRNAIGNRFAVLYCTGRRFLPVVAGGLRGKFFER